MSELVDEGDGEREEKMALLAGKFASPSDISRSLVSVPAVEGGPERWFRKVD